MYMRKKNGNPYLPIDPNDRTNPDDGSNGGGGGSNYTDDSFPLKKGSGGDAVETLQKMISKIGGGVDKVLPKFGVDGKFGDETATALSKLGYSEIVTEKVMDDIIADVKAETEKTEGFWNELFS